MNSDVYMNIKYACEGKNLNGTKVTYGVGVSQPTKKKIARLSILNYKKAIIKVLARIKE